MFAWDNNRESSQNTFRLFGKLTQKFGSEESNDENSASTVKNAFITIQGDYTNNKYTFVDSDHQFDLFKYGHVGTFNTYKTKVYNTGDVLDTINGNPVWWSNVQVHNGWQDTLMTFGSWKL